MTPEEMRSDANKAATTSNEMSQSAGENPLLHIGGLIGAFSAQELSTAAEVCERLDTIIELMNKLVAAAPARVYTAPRCG